MFDKKLFTLQSWSGGSWCALAGRGLSPGLVPPAEFLPCMLVCGAAILSNLHCQVGCVCVQKKYSVLKGKAGEENSRKLKGEVEIPHSLTAACFSF